MALRGAPAMAFAMAWRMAQVVKTLVERPMHVATVKGFRRKLVDNMSAPIHHVSPARECAYAAATVKPPHRFPLRGDLNSADAPASPESAILTSASALRRSTAMYRRYVNMGKVATSGSIEKSGRKRGAWW